jgi:hypothetical protein
MKKIWGIILVLNFGVQMHSFAQQNIRNWIVDRTATFSPGSYRLIQQYDNLPGKLVIKRGSSTISTTKSTDAFHYLKLDSKEDALQSMSTNVHEIGHAYGGLLHYEELMNCNCDRTIKFGDIQQGFYQSAQEAFWIDINKSYIFPSNNLNNVIPANMVTFRHQTYINGTSSTQGHGVIGLLDEMNAYYLGSKFHFDMYPVYKELYPSDYLNEWVSHSMSEMTAFFEFDYFIKEYLLYANKYQPQTYTYLKNHPQFKIAYQRIYAKFKALTVQYEERVNKEKSGTSFYHQSVFWKDDYHKLVSRLNSGIFHIINSDFLN